MPITAAKANDISATVILIQYDISHPPKLKNAVYDIFKLHSPACFKKKNVSAFYTGF